MDQSDSGVGAWRADNLDALQRADGEPCVSRSGIDLYGHGGVRIDESLMTQATGPHGSLPSTSCRPSRSVSRLEDTQRPFTNRSGAGLTHQPQRGFTPTFLPQSSLHNRSDRYIARQQPGSQLLQPRAAMLDHVVRKPFTADVERVHQRNEIRYSNPSTRGISRSMSNPGFTSRHGSAQAAIEASLQKKRQVQSSLLSTVPKYPREHPLFTQAAEIVKAAQGTVRGEVSRHEITSMRDSPLRLSKPTSTEWTTYRVDTKGTRLPKTVPPPQGTYKVSEGFGKTDYSDPRDFFAPTIQEQKYVWNALRATRAAFYELTNIQLKPNDMKTLYMGYNAAWNEIKRMFTTWIFENFSPDRSGPDRTTAPVHELSCEVPGYAAEALQVVVNQPHNPKNIKYFVNGELAINLDDLLPKLERWYGLIADYRFSPTWTYERQRNSRGFLIQNPDCCACTHCRKNQILCYGFRERADRKCTPCVVAGLSCSNEEEVRN